MVAVDNSLINSQPNKQFASLAATDSSIDFRMNLWQHTVNGGISAQSAYLKSAFLQGALIRQGWVMQERDLLILFLRRKD